MGLLAEQFRDLRHHRRHASGAADQDHLVDIGRSHARVFQGGRCRGDSTLHKGADKLLQLRPGQGHRQMLWTGRVGGDERQVQLRLRHRRKLDLRPFALNAQALERCGVFPEIDAVVGLELVRRPVHDGQVKIVAAEVRVPVG